MDDAALVRRVWDGIGALQEWVELGSAEGRRVTLPAGAVASVCPATPDRSLLNSVVAPTAALEQVLPAAAEVYEDAGVRAWTVWVGAADTAAHAVLAAHGHARDAQPMGMGLALAGLPDEVRGEPEWTGDWAAWPEAMLVNDRAYGDPDGLTAAAMGDLPAGAGHLYVHRADGEAVAFVLVRDIGDDVDFALAATVPAARRRGLVTALLHRALLDGRARGCATSSTVASPMGEPVYAALGYRRLGRVQMWERRATPPE